MFYIIQGVILFCITTIIITATIRALRISHAIKSHRQIESDIGSCGALGFVGCSIVCSRVKEVGRIESLLGSEYDRYEIVVTLDSFVDTEAFNAILRHFKMIQVNTPSSEALPESNIRALYRSRHRCFRRLVLIDKPYGSAYDDFNAATIVAAYDFILPIRGNTLLRKHAIESIAVTLTGLHNKTINLLRSSADNTCIFRREALLAAGGFGRNLLKKIPSDTRHTISLPLRYPTPRALRKGVFKGVAIIVCLLLWAIFTPHPATRVALLAAIVAMGSISRYLVLIIDDRDSLRHTVCNIGNSVSLFYRTNFFV